MSWNNLFALTGGLGLFLYGMKTLNEALEKAAGSRLKMVLQGLVARRTTALLAGVAVTALIQSSSATTVMVVGFVNASLITLSQAVNVIMGANIGTTFTSLILSLKLDFSAIFASIGLLLLFIFRRSNLRFVGMILMSLAILFTGMDAMSQAMSPLREWRGFHDLIASLSSPLAGVLAGALITAILQSSSASIGILQAITAQGLITLGSALYILFGQNIGTCVTALLASSGANTTARRAAIVHLLFNLIGTGLFILLALLLPLDRFIMNLAPDNLKLQIALTHVIFNVGTTLLLLPFANGLERIACKLIHDK